MREVATVLGGIGLLIFGCLILTHADSATAVVGQASSSLTDTISTLQGNSAAVGSNGGYGRLTQSARFARRG